MVKRGSLCVRSWNTLIMLSRKILYLRLNNLTHSTPLEEQMIMISVFSLSASLSSLEEKSPLSAYQVKMKISTTTERQPLQAGATLLTVTVNQKCWGMLILPLWKTKSVMRNGRNIVGKFWTVWFVQGQKERMLVEVTQEVIISYNKNAKISTLKSVSA